MAIQLILFNNQTFKDANYKEEENKPLNKITSKVTRSRAIFWKNFKPFMKYCNHDKFQGLSAVLKILQLQGEGIYLTSLLLRKIKDLG